MKKRKKRESKLQYKIGERYNFTLTCGVGFNCKLNGMTTFGGVKFLDCHSLYDLNPMLVNPNHIVAIRPQVLYTSEERGSDDDNDFDDLPIGRGAG